jgi:hypothetical protein
VASEEFKLAYARLYIQRTYPLNDAGKLAALKTLANQCFEGATDTVTITSASSEGGQASGVISFEKVILAKAIEEWLAVIDPAYVAPPPAQPLGTVLQFSPDC